MRLLLLFIPLVFLLQCSVIRTKDRDGLAIKTRDTHFNARKGEELRKRITVLPFLNLSSYRDNHFTEDARAYFLSELEKTNETVILDWQKMGIDNLDTHRNGGDYKIGEIAKKMRSSPVQAIVVGVVKDLRTGKRGDSVGLFRKVKAEIKATVELRIIAVRSGQVLATETQEADFVETQTRIGERVISDTSSKDDPSSVRYVIETAFEKAIPGLIAALQKFSWEGRVALVKGEQIYLNAGRLSGLHVGDILRVVEPQEEVFDPQTENFIGHIKGRVKGTVEVLSYFGNDGAVTTIHSGAGFKENDLVEFY